MSTTKITFLNETEKKHEKIGFIKSVQVAINAIGSGEMNARPKRYTCKFMAPGLTSYPDENKNDSIWWLSRKIMNDMQKSFITCPVVFQKSHDGSSNPDTFQEVAGGVVTEVWTDKDGWDYCAFIVWDQGLKKLIEERGFNVSCAFDTLDYTEGGVLNAIKYDHEVTNAQYIHLAIVEAPRQTGAQIFLNNVDNKNESVIIFKAMWKGEQTIMKLWPHGKTMKNEAAETEEQKKAREIKEAEEKAEADKKKNSETEIDADKATIEVEGVQIPLKDLVTTYEAEQAEIAKKKELDSRSLTMDSEYKGVKVAAMYESYKKSKASEAEVKKNAEDEEKKKVEEKEAEAKKNAEAEEEEKKKKEHFNSLEKARNANPDAITLPVMISKDDRVIAAKKDY